MRILLTCLLLSAYITNTSCMEGPGVLLRELGDAVIKTKECTSNFTKIDPDNQADILRQLIELEQKSRALRNKLNIPMPWDTEISGK